MRILFLLFILFTNASIAQYTNNVWCFGDSAGIKFNNGTPTFFTSSADGRGTSVSICDSSGNLMFYGNTNNIALYLLGSLKEGILFDKNHQKMIGGDTLIGGVWYHEMVIVPKPKSDSFFFVFSIDLTIYKYLFYQEVDLKLNNGLGQVVQKNVVLDSVDVFDCLTAVKHGNGQDWWLIYRQWGPGSIDSSNTYYLLLIDSNGITKYPAQSIGSYHHANGGDITFNTNGSKMCFVDLAGMIEYYDFDRCTGAINNPILIEPEKPPGGPYPYYSSCVFSPNGNYLYVHSYRNQYQLNNIIYQYDLTTANISLSKQIIHEFANLDEGSWSMELGPDKKIYIATNYFGTGSSLPYSYTLHNYVTDNLSVINYPDSAGAACDFQPFSFNLGGGRCYAGLPNNPDYTMGPLAGSVCDTLTALPTINKRLNNTLKVFYHESWGIAFINADKLKGKQYSFRLYDTSGRELYSEKGNLSIPYFSKDLSMQPFMQGVYIAVLQTDKEKLSAKFVK